MEELSFSENELTGARVTVPFTALQRFGPKHHAIVIGKSETDDDIWIAELSRKHGYRLVALTRWLDDNRDFLDGLKIEPSEGPRTGREIAQSAIAEVQEANTKERRYNVIFNNCESFANRHVTGTAKLSPQVQTAFRLLGFVAVSGAWILKRHWNRHSNA